MWMNEYDIEDALTRFTDETPNLKRGAQILDTLKEWTNANSDGWPYWKKPSNAARKLMDLVGAARGSSPYTIADITEAELKAALTPIKSFLTRQEVNHAEILG
jgi:hypothetical protein